MLLGLFEHRYNWDWPAAEREFQQALDIDPDLTMAHHQYGFSLVLQTQFDAGIDHLKLAVARDPQSARMHTDLALAYLYQQRWSESEREINSALGIDPKYFPALWARGIWHLHQGNLARAQEDLEAAHREDRSPEATAELAYCLGKAGNAKAARKLADELTQRLAAGEHIPAAAIAVSELGLGPKRHSPATRPFARRRDDKDEWLVWLAVDPVFDDLADEDRFQAIRAKIGLWPGK